MLKIASHSISQLNDFFINLLSDRVKRNLKAYIYQLLSDHTDVGLPVTDAAKACRDLRLCKTNIITITG